MTDSQTIPDDIRDTAKHIAEQPWLTRAERDRMAEQIAKAIHDAVMAERERWSPASIYFERYCQDEADAAENRISEQQHIDAKALAAVVRGEG